jgi:predicted ATPase/serine/threonine protein kinase
MTPERWRRVQELFARALELDTGEREAALTAECAGDEGLRHEVESLLEAHERTGGFSSRVTPFEDAPPSLGRLEGAVVDGKYRVDEPLGTGGMGTVYRATDLRLEREVALKVIRDDLLGEAATAERFRREAVAVARLRHPNVVTIYDYGVAPGLGAYLVMELLQGHSLRVELERRQRLEAREALDVAGQVCGAVAAAHASGIVHRDLKPENVFLEAGAGRAAVKVLDFGLAQFTEGAASLQGAITMRGAALGTPAYMSPEQCLGEEADVRSDVYALGCLLYEMLAGRPPFVAPAVTALLLKHVNDPPRPLGELVPGIDPALEAAVARALAKAPADRYQTVEALARALGRPVRSAGHETLAPGGATLSSMGAVTAAPDTGPPDADALRTNLRHAVTRFVGRQREIAEIREWLGRTRLVTLVGPGGIGKTRLALETARLVLGEHRDGVWLVELAALADPSLVAQAVVSALGVRERRGRSEGDLLAEELRDKQLLLVLDNCEHLVDACARLAERLLEEAPGLRVLATSREALGVAGEAAWPVPALAVPASDDEAFECEAAALFRDRASLARPGLELTKSSAATIAALCRRLEGVPLAIELAAARVRALSVDEILERLADRFRLLAAGSRTAPSRQQTLRATIDWSWDLLADEERALLRRLSVFAGGFELEAAEAVCAGGRVETSDVLDLLSRLVDKSLVTVGERATVRYRVLEMIRAYGLERLAQCDEADEVRRRHAEYFSALADESRHAIGDGRLAAWLERMEVEHDNVRAALAWLLERDADASLRLATAVCPFRELHGHFAEARRSLEAALAHGRSASARERVSALLAVGAVASMQGDRAAARGHYEEALPIARASGFADKVAWLLFGLGVVATLEDDLPAARAHLGESVTLGRQIGNDIIVGSVLNGLGEVARLEGEWEAARGFYDEALVVARRSHHEHGVSVNLCNLGAVLCEMGDPDAAEACYEESLAASRALGSVEGIGLCVDGLGAVAAKRREWARAAKLAGAAEAILDSVGAKLAPPDRAFRERYLAEALANLGEEPFEAALAEGRALPVDEALGTD